MSTPIQHARRNHGTSRDGVGRSGIPERFTMQVWPDLSSIQTIESQQIVLSARAV
jgi:hypothetical protein